MISFVDSIKPDEVVHCHTGSTDLNNELDANLVNWKEYAAVWNANKTH